MQWCAAVTVDLIDGVLRKDASGQRKTAAALFTPHVVLVEHKRHRFQTTQCSGAMQHRLHVFVVQTHQRVRIVGLAQKPVCARTGRKVSEAPIGRACKRCQRVDDVFAFERTLQSAKLGRRCDTLRVLFARRAGGALFALARLCARAVNERPARAPPKARYFFRSRFRWRLNWTTNRRCRPHRHRRRTTRPPVRRRALQLQRRRLHACV